jgi:uncharacterized protein with PCYCGC motif
MKPRNVILIAIGVLVIGSLILSSRKGEAPRSEANVAPQAAPTAPAPSAAVPASTPDTGRIPHFFNSVAEAGELPRILPSSQFPIPIVAKAYRAAAGIREVLAQQPCYCFCDKLGHGSLVDCFATDHGAG